jgi:hypothetical protein
VGLVCWEINGMGVLIQYWLGLRPTEAECLTVAWFDLFADLRLHAIHLLV